VYEIGFKEAPPNDGIAIVAGAASEAAAQIISLRKDSSVSGLIIRESNPAVMAFA